MSQRTIFYIGFAIAWLVGAYFTLVAYLMRNFDLLLPWQRPYADPGVEAFSQVWEFFQSNIGPFIMIGAVLVSAILITRGAMKWASLTLFAGVYLVLASYIGLSEFYFASQPLASN